MAITGPALIHENNVVLIGVPPPLYQIRQFRRGLARSASHVKDRSLVRVWLACMDQDNLQGQLSACSGAAILEHIINSAAQLLLYALNMAGRQRHTGRGRTGWRTIATGERD